MLMLWLKEPPMQIVVDGDLGEFVGKLSPLWRRKLFPRRITVKLHKIGQPMVFDERNVLVVRQVTAEELADAEERAANKSPGQDRRVVTPRMTFPGGH